LAGLRESVLGSSASALQLSTMLPLR
jgi:hypothetical protein